jgi:3-hydroxyisobutyrate dehydrogenase
VAREIDRTTTTIGFAGLGNLGRPMAESLRRDGWSLKVLDQEPARADGLEAEVVDGPRDLAECEVIALAVPDDDGWPAKRRSRTSDCSTYRSAGERRERFLVLSP